MQTQNSYKKPIQDVKVVIAVSSGKGGVGKSTVAVNLAVSLAMTGAKVGLLDADIHGPNIPAMMGLKETPRTQGENEKPMLIPLVAHGVKFMSIGLMLERDQPVIWRGPMLHRIVNQFCHQVAWGELDYLVVDMPPGTGDIQLSLAQLVPVSGTVLVTTPQEVSLQDVSKAFMMWKKVEVPVLGIIENMSYFKCDQCNKEHRIFGAGGGKKLAEEFKMDLLAELPLISQVREGGDLGQPIVIANPNLEIAKLFYHLAEKVITLLKMN